MDDWLPLVGGLAFLILGGELLVRGSVQVAGRLGVSPLVIGLTLVAFGTSTPELVTSVQAGLAGSPGIAYGNIVGSNMANVLLILGLSAALAPIRVSSAALKRDGFVMIAGAAVFAGLALFMPMGPVIGLLFLLALATYTLLAFRQERAATGDHGAIYGKSVATSAADPALAPGAGLRGSLLLSVATAIGGLAIVIVGGSLLVDGATGLARGFGISETVIGLTIVAVGTSMPELVTSLVAAIRKESDIAFGNIVGSNIYNILGIGGATAIIAPSLVPPEIVRFDNPIMVAVCMLVVLFAATGRRLSRWEGGILLAGYVAYLAWLWPT